MDLRAKKAELFHRRRANRAETHLLFTPQPDLPVQSVQLPIRGSQSTNSDKESVARLLVALGVVCAAYTPGARLTANVSQTGVGAQFAPLALDPNETGQNALRDVRADLEAAHTQILEDFAAFTAKMEELQVCSAGSLRHIVIAENIPDDAGVCASLNDTAEELTISSRTSALYGDVLIAFATAIRAVLQSLADDASRILSDIDLVSEDFGDHAALEIIESVFDDFLDTRFRANAAQNPNAPALVTDALRWSYEDLDRLADARAHRLHLHGVRAGDIVALVLDKSPDLVALVMAVLRVGAAYLPLSPDLPVARMRFMVTDSKAVLCVADAETPDLGVPTISLLDVSTNAEQPYKPVERHLTDCAAVIYTSGSTGNPKGVVLSHRSLARKIGSAIHQFGWNETLHCPLLGYVGSDACTYQIFVTLGCGGRLSVLPREQQLNATDFWWHLETFEATMINCVPGFLNEIMADMNTPPAQLRDVVLGGDRVTPELARIIRTRLSPERIINLYGPTEITIEAVNWTAGPDQDLADIPIGTAAPGYGVQLINDIGNRVPDGVVCEIVISGNWLADGYLNNPAGTAKAFTPDPVIAGARCYRTGDLGRQRGDGTIQYLGRRDHQVKVRGHRVETGEIEFHLKALNDVDDAIVALDTATGTRLIAYCLGPKSAAIQTIRTQLAENLPPAMIPSELRILPKWPMTPNGKIDSKKLSETWRKTAPTIAELPSDPLIRSILLVWRDILNRSEIGIDDGFFEMGGDSLRAVRLVNALRQGEKLDLGFIDLMSAPSPRTLAERLRDRDPLAVPRIPKAPKSSKGRLLPSQRRIWLHIQITPAAAAGYNMPEAYRIRGPLDLDRFSRASEALLARHEALRTSFLPHDGWVKTEVATRCTCEIRLLPKAVDPDKAIDDTLTREAALPFDFSSAPLIRFSVLPIGPDDHVVFLTTHHLVADGRSLQVLWRDLMDAYAANGSLSDVPDAVCLCDVAAWQDAWLGGPEAEAAKEYWAAEVRATSELNEAVPLDKPRPDEPDCDAGAVHLSLDRETSAKFYQFCAAQGVTPFAAAASVVAYIVARYSGQDFAAFLTDVPGRNHADLEELVGYFGNLVLLRLEASATSDFVGLVKEAQDNISVALSHQAYPFDRILEDNAVSRRVGRTPLASILVEMQIDDPFENQRTSVEGLHLSHVPPPDVTDVFDLAFSFRTSEQFALRLSYLKSLFNRATAKTLVSQFSALLKHALEHPTLTLTTDAMIADQERQALMTTWNPEQHYSASTETLADRFRKAVHQWPDRIALRQDASALSYRELDRRIDMLARQLTGHLEPKHGIVAIALSRGIAAVETILAAVRAGYAYCPVDTQQPASRLQLILNKLKPALVIVDDVKTGIASEIDDWPVISLDGLTSSVPSDEPFRRASANEAAYAITTSGSTGTPKTVLVSHRAIGTSIAWKAREHKIGPDAKLLSASALHFDTSIGDVHTALCFGAELVLPNSVNGLELDQLGDTIEAAEVTHTVLLPNFYACLLESIPQKLTSLRRIIVGGEQVLPGLVTRHFEQAAHAEFVNEYGPAETAVCTTFQRMEGHDDIVRIGWPVDGRVIDLLDPAGTLAPVGVPAEIFVSGPSLATCYLNQPIETAERFLPHPLRPNRRMYRTGDVARRRSDGTLEYIGRVDDQVKIRGMRVELGEIRRWLAAQTNNPQVAVVAPRQADGERVLIAYIAANPDRLNIPDQRTALRSKLPDYMVPDRIITLPSLPLTATGKIDLRALEQQALPAVDTATRAATAIEAKILDIWSGILATDITDPDADFFAVGGHSLAALRVASLLRSAFAVELTIPEIFKARSVAGLAVLISNRYGQLPDVDARPAPVPSSDASRPLGALQRRIWLSAAPQDHEDLGLLHGFVLNNPIPAAVLKQRCIALVEEQPDLRAKISQDGDQYFLVPSSAPKSLVSTRTLATGQSPEAYLAHLPASKIDPAHGAPLHFEMLINQRNQAVGILITVHHIVCDAAGVQTISHSILAPDEPFQPATLEGPMASPQEARAYWENVLSQSGPKKTIAYDFDVAPETHRHGVWLEHRFSDISAQRLVERAGEFGVGLYALFQAAAAQMFCDETGSSNIVLGFPSVQTPEFPGEVNCNIDAAAVSLAPKGINHLLETANAAQLGLVSALHNRAVSPLDIDHRFATSMGVTWEDLGESEITGCRPVTMHRKREALETDLWFYLHKADTAMSLSLVYDRARYRHATAKRLLATVVNIALAENPVDSAIPNDESSGKFSF